MIGVATPSFAYPEYNVNTSKKFEVYSQEVESIRGKFIKEMNITNAVDQAGVNPTGIVESSNRVLDKSWL